MTPVINNEPGQLRNDGLPLVLEMEMQDKFGTPDSKARHS